MAVLHSRQTGKPPCCGPWSSTSICNFRHFTVWDTARRRPYISSFPTLLRGNACHDAPRRGDSRKNFIHYPAAPPDQPRHRGTGPAAFVARTRSVAADCVPTRSVGTRWRSEVASPLLNPAGSAPHAAFAGDLLVGQAAAAVCSSTARPPCRWFMFQGHDVDQAVTCRSRQRTCTGECFGRLGGKPSIQHSPMLMQAVGLVRVSLPTP